MGKYKLLLVGLVLVLVIILYLPVPRLEKDLHPKNKGLDILFVGDVMLGRHVETLMLSRGAGYPFQKISNFLKQHDLVVANLEGPIVEDHVQTPMQSFQFSFLPDSPRVLKDNNITIVSLANNHALDYGGEGLRDTEKYLSKNNIGYFGDAVRAREGEVAQRRIGEINGEENFVFMGFNATYPSFHIEEAKNVVSRYASSTDSFAIVYMHWGEEYKKRSSEAQRNIAHALIDGGADLIVGSHPHVVQEIEKYKNKLIFYSLGNFIFDQYFSKDTQEALVFSVNLNLDRSKITYHLYPVESVRSQPMVMEEGAAKEWLKNLADKSSPELREEIQLGIITINDNK